MDIVMCWKCTHGIPVRKQFDKPDAPYQPVCTLAKLIISDPRRPPKSCAARNAGADFVQE